MVGPEFREFGRHSPGEPLPTQRFGGDSDGRAERNAVQLAHLDQARIGLPVDPNSRSHGWSIG